MVEPGRERKSTLVMLDTGGELIALHQNAPQILVALGEVGIYAQGIPEAAFCLLELAPPLQNDA